MADKLSNMLKKPKDLIGGALHTLKGPDVNTLVEDFTREMAMVAEGLCDDQMRLRREVSDLSAQQTLLEAQWPQALQAHQERLSKELQQSAARLEELQKKLQALEARQQKAGKKSRVLAQLTVLVSIPAGAWVLVTLLGCILAAITFFIGGVCGFGAILLWFITVYWAYEAYQGKYFEIPWLTEFLKGQNWL